MGKSEKLFKDIKLIELILITIDKFMLDKNCFISMFINLSYYSNQLSSTHDLDKLNLQGLCGVLGNYVETDSSQIVSDIELNDLIEEIKTVSNSYLNKSKELISQIANNDSELISATALSNSWVMCPLCQEAWEELPADSVICCPKCMTLAINPLFNRKVINLQ